MYELLEVAGRYGEHAGWGPGGGGPWWVVFPILWIALVGAVIWLVARRHSHHHGQESPVERAVGILSARYARGEIETEEYRRRLDEMRGLS
jgi:putative membrane protein